MTDLKLKGRHPISDKDAKAANDAVEERFGIRPLPEDDLVEKAKAGDFELLLVDGRPFVVLEGLPEQTGPVPTLRAILADRPERAHVTVDMGAVPHLRNGADVMSPGITEADDAIEPGDLVWIRDEEHAAPLAIGQALVDGPEMADADQGKAIAVWHYVGDELWQVGA